MRAVVDKVQSDAMSWLHPYLQGQGLSELPSRFGVACSIDLYDFAYSLMQRGFQMILKEVQPRTISTFELVLLLCLLL